MKNTLRVLIATIGVLLLATGAAWGAKPGITVAITALDSYGSLIESPAAQGAGTQQEWFYKFTTTLNTFDIFFPEQICTSGGGATYAGPLTVTIGPPNGNGGNLPLVSTVTDPASVTFSGDGCQTAILEVNASTPLTNGQYNLNRVWSVTSNSTGLSAALTGKGLHIHIKVDAAAAETIKCQITSSDYNFLTDCNGNLINADTPPPPDGPGPNAGTFAIQANNKKVETSTNPGQFYYNVFWYNPGPDPQTVSVTFARSNLEYLTGDVVSTGANAIHGMVFPTFDNYYLSPTQFSAVNSAEPYGSNDNGISSVSVPGGSVLWVDYHLKWAGINKAVPPLAGVGCKNANQVFNVTATITFADASTVSCNAMATGYIAK